MDGWIKKMQLPESVGLRTVWATFYALHLEGGSTSEERNMEMVKKSFYFG